ncbi:hypothetical protein LY90DRAFT_697949 [Neocallimastix californiae]|jgi:hypothetical protein|uniref:Small nuclear ribonucleoprotein Prp3 C-terminal domain-containing protein n=1 Tax=Neocallimastix californiae TaxID=1754190 RepID=A0A1Y2F9U4_9FUNG|nr:hypothetical protein LY90DRAFT_697949 [Neocallimastix californiae]|eukprot:ORY80106.1 hypothetical protein LY90DRAFT_697949 [Neocallimastix californiae]
MEDSDLSSFVEQQVITFQLLNSMYLEDEFSINSDINSFIESCINNDFDITQASLENIPTSITFTISLKILLEDDKEEILPLKCTLPLRLNNPKQWAILSIGSVDWINKESHQNLTRDFQQHVEEQSDDDLITSSDTLILDCIEWLQTNSPNYSTKLDEDDNKNKNEEEEGPLEFLREWIYLPMLYSKEKREDLITYAKPFGFTGFVSPGKPACICIEGQAKDIPKYLNDIRSISWADIPPRDKKMSTRAQERFICQTKEEFEKHRKFEPMEERHFKIHGNRSNHQSMDLLEQWLIEKGCPNAFHDLFPDLNK